MTTPACAAAFEIVRSKKQDQIDPAGTKDDSGTGDIVDAAEPAPLREPLVALTGVSDKGWDIDVFWCDDENNRAADANYDRAMLFGQQLASLVEKDQRLKDKQIGRVRVRRLAQVLWSSASEFSGLAGGEFVRFGPENGEEALADALSRMNSEYPLKKQKAEATRTNWYVSTYFCRASVGDGNSSFASDASALAL